MEFVAELKQFEVLQSNQIISFRKYIQKKYPTASRQQRSIILADAIDKVIDNYIQDFNKEIRDQVKHEVLQRAVITDNYNICGSDIFRACLFIKDTGDNFNVSLINWLNEKCNNPIEEKYIDILLTKVVNSYNEYSNYELDSIIGKSIINLEDDGDNPTMEIDPTSFRELFVVRVRLTYKYLKGKISRQYVLDHILVTSLMLITLLNSNQYVVGQDKYITVNPQMILAELQYKERNNEASLTQENTHQENNVDERLMPVLGYRQIDENSLINVLSKRGSLLSVEPYFSSIIQASHEYDINPLLLFAITGQEQSFVPENAKNARLIANNPFNVYGSWQIYNTNILDSARIAAKLVATLSENRPLSIDPIVWINTKYAEDKRWHIGVTKLLEELNREMLLERDLLERAASS